MLNISKETNGTSLAVTLEGRLDTTTAPELEGVLRDSLEVTGFSVILNIE